MRLTHKAVIDTIVETDCYLPVISPHSKLLHSDASETEIVNDEIRDYVQIHIH